MIKPQKGTPMGRTEALLYQPPKTESEVKLEGLILSTERPGWSFGTLKEAITQHRSQNDPQVNLLVEYQDGESIKGGTVLAVSEDEAVIGVTPLDGSDSDQYQSNRVVPLTTQVLFTLITHFDNAAFPSWKNKL